MLKWKKEVPTVVGWYWLRDLTSRHDSKPHIVEVRDYAGALAIGNCHLKGWERMQKSEWAGPICEPESQE